MIFSQHYQMFTSFSVSGVRCAEVRVVWLRRDNYQDLARARERRGEMIYISFGGTNLELDQAA